MDSKKLKLIKFKEGFLKDVYKKITLEYESISINEHEIEMTSDDEGNIVTLGDYLNYLESKKITNVPVVIEYITKLDVLNGIKDLKLLGVLKIEDYQVQKFAEVLYEKCENLEVWEFKLLMSECAEETIWDIATILKIKNRERFGK